MQMYPTPSELPPLVGGRYRPIREIGRGGMGVVYEVEHVHTGERLALKVLVARSDGSTETVDRFKREARASAQIKSDHVVRVTDADVLRERGNVPYVVMELLEGQDLENYAGAAPQPPALVVEWLRQVARALDRAHRLGIVHRDLKPANLFLSQRDDGSPIVKILDFGIAKMIFERGATTAPGEVLGTPMYMAPEQAGNSGDLSGATDRHALGMIAYRLLVGETYLRGDSLVQLVNELVYQPMALPSARGAMLGGAFDAWFMKACAREPAARFGSSSEQVEALAEALGLPRLEMPQIASNPPGRASGGEITPENPRLQITPRSGDSPMDRLALTRTQRETTLRSRSWRGWWVAAALLGLLGIGALVAVFAKMRVDVVAAARDAEPGPVVSGSAAPVGSVEIVATADTVPAPMPKAPVSAEAPREAAADAGAAAGRPRPKGHGPRPARTVDPFGDQM